LLAGTAGGTKGILRTGYKKYPLPVDTHRAASAMREREKIQQAYERSCFHKTFPVELFLRHSNR
jgi:hypothetical protein